MASGSPRTKSDRHDRHLYRPTRTRARRREVCTSARHACRSCPGRPQPTPPPGPPAPSPAPVAAFSGDVARARSGPVSGLRLIAAAVPFAESDARAKSGRFAPRLQAAEKPLADAAAVVVNCTTDAPFAWRALDTPSVSATEGTWALMVEHGGPWGAAVLPRRLARVASVSLRATRAPCLGVSS